MTYGQFLILGDALGFLEFREREFSASLTGGEMDKVYERVFDPTVIANRTFSDKEKEKIAKWRDKFKVD